MKPNNQTNDIRTVPDYTIEAVQQMFSDASARFSKARHPSAVAEEYGYGSVTHVEAVAEYETAITELTSYHRILKVLRGEE